MGETEQTATESRLNHINRTGWVALISIGLLIGGLAIAQGAAADTPTRIAEPVDVDTDDDRADDPVAAEFDRDAWPTVSLSNHPGALIVVCEDGPPSCNTASIQAAIDFAAPGDTIVVRPGNYTEGNETSLVIDTADLTILAEHAAGDVAAGFDEDADRPVFDAKGAAAAVTFEADVGEAHIEGFEIGGNWTACGICQGLSTMQGTSPQIVDNVVNAPEDTDTHGNTIQITGENASVIGNDVSVPHQVSPDWTGTGILAFSTIDAQIQDNVVESSPSDACIAVGGGMFFDLRAAVDNTIQDNTVESTIEARDLACDEGILIQGSVNDTTIQGNTLADTFQGVDLDEARGEAPNRVTIVDNTFRNNVQHVRAEAPGVDIDLDPVLDDNSFDQAVVVRDQGEITPQTIFSSIQDGIDEASDGNTVDVRPGTYEESLDITSVDSLTLLGAGSDQVTIDASDQTGRAIAAEYSSGGGATDVGLEGFTLIGTPDDYGLKLAFIDGIEVRDVAVQDSHRTAIDLHTVEDAVLADVEATNTSSGNGIAVRNAVNVTLDGATTSGNAWGGLAFYAPGDEVVENAVVKDSTFTGEAAGIYAQYSDLDIALDNVELTGNEIGFATLLFGDLAPTDFAVEIEASTIAGNDQAGVLIQGDGGSLDVAAGTTFEDNGVGLDVQADFAVVNVEDATFSGNDVGVENAAETVSTVIRHSQITDNEVGVRNTAQNALVDARENHWGSPLGPTADDRTAPAAVTGDSVEGDVVYRPWCVDEDCTVTVSGGVDI